MNLKVTNSAPNGKSPLSGQDSQLVLEAKVLGKYAANFYYDETSKTIFADQPYWLDEAYDAAISVTDTGILHRNIETIEASSQIIMDFADDPTSIRGVDLGAGYGLFVRGMRDKGFNFHWSDLYAENLMARGFEAAPGDYDVAVAFEVLEHLINPVEFLKQQQSQYKFRRLIFSAQCFDPANIPDASWWYWSLESGQHVSFFSEEGLAYIAQQLGMRVRRVVRDVYLMEDENLPAFQSVHDRKGLQRLADKLRRHKRRQQKAMPASLTWDDHIKMRDQLRAR